MSVWIHPGVAWVGLGLLGCGLFMPLDGRAEEKEAAAAARVLIVTGQDYPGHQWQETAPVLAEAIWSVLTIPTAIALTSGLPV